MICFAMWSFAVEHWTQALQQSSSPVNLGNLTSSSDTLHQIIAQALGVPLICNPCGWVHGAVEVSRVQRTPWSGSNASFALYGSHIEQVSALPAEAVRLFESPGCPIAGFGIGNTVFTIQHHPEMTRDFISDLIAEYADHVGPDVTEIARRSVAEAQVDRKAFAEEIAAFFEQGAR